MDKNINKEMPAWLNTFVNSIVKLKKTAADDEDFDDEEEIEDDEPSSPMDMRNDFSPEPSSDSFDNQMDDTLSNGQQEENFNSEININDLDTITWQDNEYKVVYKIDLDKISDSDLARFNLDRDLDKTRSNYEDLGYTCD